MSDAMVLVLEDGFTVFGERGGQAVQASGEIVINTCMAGYQEVLSDPSYAGQMVVMTYPMIGNYGLAAADFEARKPFLAALIVKEPSRIASSWRSTTTLDAYLVKHKIPGLYGLDT